MSLRNAALAGLLVLGSATAAVSVPANAATVACGGSCLSLMPERYGYADFMATQPFRTIRGLPNGTGQPVILAAAAQDASEDWQAQDLGTAAQLAADGIVTAVVGHTWPQAEALQYSYTPDGQSTGLCLGVAGTAGQGTPVTLQPCGTPFATVWIKIAKNLDRYGPLVSGTDTRAIWPYALSAGNPGSPLDTGLLFGTSVRNYSPNQMWGTWFGTY
jgi:hypothetical protein